jgi:hypothetical protein
MDARPVLPPPTPPPEPRLISPHQVWSHLTGGQQRSLLQTLVLICQELLVPPRPPGRNGSDD